LELLLYFNVHRLCDNLRVGLFLGRMGGDLAPSLGEQKIISRTNFSNDLIL